jgi:hypothetical protein
MPITMDENVTFLQSALESGLANRADIDGSRTISPGGAKGGLTSVLVTGATSLEDMAAMGEKGAAEFDDD